MSQKKKKLYMLVSEDEYEMPLAVADNIPELARMIGVNENSIYSAISHRKSRKKRTTTRGSKPKYLEVYVDD